MEELRDYLVALIDTFRQQPVDWIEKIAGIQAPALNSVPDFELWSAHQVVTHVQAADRHALLPRLRRIMTEDRPDLPNWDEGQWMVENYDPELALVAAMKDWQEERAELGDQLAELPLAEWDRTGLHVSQGERTLLWWLEYTVGHVKDHEDQLDAILAGMTELSS